MSPSRPTQVLVIRHGQSTWNAEGRWQGQADPPLTELGELQAVQAAGVLPTVDAVVASDLQRAALTATIIAAERGLGPVALDRRLRERNAGAWQGLTHHEVETQWPGYLSAGRRPPGFEPAEVAGARALAAVRAAAARADGGAVLAVSHGGILRAMRALLGIEEELGFANLSGQWFTVHADDVSPGPLVSLLDGERPLPTTPL